MNDVALPFANYIDMIASVLATWGLKVLGALVVLVIGRWVAKAVERSVKRVMTGRESDPTLTAFLSSLAYYVILAVVLISVLGIVGVQTASLLAVFGAAGLAVGLALQGTLSNVAAGVMLLVFRPFKVGDYVDVGGTAGSVASIGLFATELNTPDNIYIVVPNSSIYGGTIKNYSHHPIRRNDLLMGVSYDDDIALAMKTIQEVLDADERILAEPAPVVAVSELADSSVNLVVRPWCNTSDFWPLRFDLTRALKERLEAAGCSIPYPQQDVYLHKVD
jgi:small conductance mechanosensitive channel